MAGSRIDYRAVAGTLVVHPQGWDDTPKIAGMDQSELDRQDRNQAEGGTSDKKPKHRWSTSPILRRVRRRRRGPLTFLFHGGPGSSTVWLHMGAFGPKRVVTADDTHSQGAPYAIVNNDQSLLDASDLVFVDAPGTGFSRIAGKDKEKAFYGVDADAYAYAFAELITAFLSKYDQWNSPKYLFGGGADQPLGNQTLHRFQWRRSVVANPEFRRQPRRTTFNPGVDLPY